MPKAGFGATIDIISFSGFECPSSYHGVSLSVTECHGVCHRLSAFLDLALLWSLPVSTQTFPEFPPGGRDSVAHRQTDAHP